MSPLCPLNTFTKNHIPNTKFHHHPLGIKVTLVANHSLTDDPPFSFFSPSLSFSPTFHPKSVTSLHLLHSSSLSLRFYSSSLFFLLLFSLSLSLFCSFLRYFHPVIQRSTLMCAAHSLNGCYCSTPVLSWPLTELLLTRAHKSEDESSRLGDAMASKGCISFSDLECLGSCLAALVIIWWRVSSLSLATLCVSL